MPNKLLTKARELPDEPGCYIMKDTRGHEIYVGKARSLRRRVASYFQAKDRLGKEQALVENIADFEYVVTDSEVEAVLLESRLIKDLRPRYNFLLRNNEQYPYLEVTLGEDFPRALVTREHRPGKSRHFGPFPSAADLRAVLSRLGRVFKFRTCNLRLRADDPKARFRRPCLNYHIGRCTAPCAGLVSRREYRRQIAGLLLFFGGRKRALVKSLDREMQAAAKALRYEEAAELRDALAALERIHDAPALDQELAPAVPIIDPTKGLESLRRALGLERAPRRIEGVDIANLQGGEMVGAVVTFLDALPFKDGYRRYRIKTVAGQDDFASMAEVVRRRYTRLRREKGELPDLVLVDGGRGQVRAAAQALAKARVRVPVLMGLAKEEEVPLLAGRSEPVRLSRRSAGLKLLMFVRDEAHRFAQHYHHILRRKALFQ